jgi:hypothetical protein
MSPSDEGSGVAARPEEWSMEMNVEDHLNHVVVGRFTRDSIGPYA